MCPIFSVKWETVEKQTRHCLENGIAVRSCLTKASLSEIERSAASEAPVTDSRD